MFESLFPCLTIALVTRPGGSGEGLFAARDIEPNTILAFYNGKRIKPRSPEDYDHPDWDVNAYKIFDPTRKNGTIDIPKQVKQAFTQGVYSQNLSDLLWKEVEMKM